MANAPEDINNLIISKSHIELLRGQELGRGAYAKAFKAKYRGSLCAAKEIYPLLIESAYTLSERNRLRDDFIRECHLCSTLYHPNIIDFIGIYYPSQQSFPVMIMELMDESLTKYAKMHKISFKMSFSILYDVAEGLSYLHSRNPPIIHCDLSPNSILLKNVPGYVAVKIAGLGSAQVINVDQKKSQQILLKCPGTVHFMPPESFEDEPLYDTSLDVFSYSGIMLYTINGEWPTPTVQYKRNPVTRQVNALTEVQRRQEYLDKMTGEAEVLRPLVEACLDNDPVKRPSIIELSERILALKVCS